MRACLKTFQTFLTWIPFPYIFDTELINLILNYFLAPTTSRIVSDAPARTSPGSASNDSNASNSTDSNSDTVNYIYN